MRTLLIAISLLPLSIFAQEGTKATEKGGIKWMTIEQAQTKAKDTPKPLMVDVYTSWCGPCKMIAPILDEVANTYGDKIQIAKMNVDENRDIPAKFGIRGIPTLMLFKGGQLAATKVGALGKAQLTSFIDEQLA